MLNTITNYGSYHKLRRYYKLRRNNVTNMRDDLRNIFLNGKQIFNGSVGTEYYLSAKLSRSVLREQYPGTDILLGASSASAN